MKRHSESTLMHMTKAELIKYVRMAERNQDIADADLRQLEENLKYWEPVRHGYWTKSPIKESMLSMCSQCEFPCGAYSFNYCPNCGAKMDGGDET